MPVADASNPAVDADPLRREYEESLSWRVAGPLRTAGRLAVVVPRRR